MKYFTLYKLNKSIQKLLNGIGRDFWIVAEIAQVQLGNHCYMELVEKEEDGTAIIAKARAAIWYSQLQVLRQKLGDSMEQILSVGAKAMMRVQVNYHEVHGLSLVVVDLNESFTLGELEKKRLETIKKLTDQQLIDRQQLLFLPPVIQRIAIISSPTAAGYSDFMNQLQHNNYGYQFHLTMYPSAVQGERAEKELLVQLAKISGGDYDAIVIIRGGGSKLDLEVFNSYDIAAQIALHEVPILTGIGHQRDTSVCDLVAKASLKTPTALAEFLIQQMLYFESQALECFQGILSLSNHTLQYHKDALHLNSQQIYQQTRHTLQQHAIRLSNQAVLLKNWTLNSIKQEKLQLEHLSKQVQALSPENILAKGYTITYLNGALLKDQKTKKGDQIKTVTAKGSVESEVSK